MGDVAIRRARNDEAATLTAVALTAKQHWGYPDAWIEQWRPALTITSHYLRASITRVATRGDAVIGFGSVSLSGSRATLDHLWVLPHSMRQGLGRQLFELLERETIRAGGLRLNATADPHAEVFYHRMGLRTIGYQPAPMEGLPRRALPLLEKVLVNKIPRPAAR